MILLYYTILYYTILYYNILFFVDDVTEACPHQTPPGVCSCTETPGPREGFADRSRTLPTATVWPPCPGGASHGNGNPNGPAPWALVPAAAPAKSLKPPFG